jgi:hypothetical protein
VVQWLGGIVPVMVVGGGGGEGVQGWMTHGVFPLAHGQRTSPTKAF